MFKVRFPAEAPAAPFPHPCFTQRILQRVCTASEPFCLLPSQSRRLPLSHVHSTLCVLLSCPFPGVGNVSPAMLSEQGDIPHGAFFAQLSGWGQVKMETERKKETKLQPARCIEGLHTHASNQLWIESFEEHNFCTEKLLNLFLVIIP